MYGSKNHDNNFANKKVTIKDPKTFLYLICNLLKLWCFLHKEVARLKIMGE